MKPRTLRTTLALAVVVFAALPVAAADREQARPARGDEFFIISSVNASKHQLVLKRPTEVTELMAVTDSTVYVDEQGKPLRFEDLRAGDTVYVAYTNRSEGPPVASRIRRGPMTLEELHQRYLPAAGVR
jgi:hypothetical protein